MHRHYLPCLQQFRSPVEDKEIFSGGIKVVKLKVIITLLVGLCGHFAQCASSGMDLCIGTCEVEEILAVTVSFALTGLMLTAENPFLTATLAPHLSGGGGGGGFPRQRGSFRCRRSRFP